MANTVPTQITDKNGKQTTVHKRSDSSASTSTRELPGVGSRQYATPRNSRWMAHQVEGIYADNPQATIEEAASKKQELSREWSKNAYDNLRVGDYSKDAHELIFEYAQNKEAAGSYVETEFTYADLSDIAATVLDNVGNAPDPRVNPDAIRTEDVRAKIRELPFPGFVNETAIAAYRANQDAAEAEWRTGLNARHNDGLSKEATDAIFDYAVTKNGFDGLVKVEEQYAELTDLARRIIEAEK